MITGKKRVEVKDYEKALREIHDLCKPGHTVDEFSWGLLASYCKVSNGETGLRLEINLPGSSHMLSLEEADEEMIYERTKKAIIEAVQHVLYCNELQIEQFRRDGHKIYNSMPPVAKNRKFDKKLKEKVA